MEYVTKWTLLDSLPVHRVRLLSVADYRREEQQNRRVDLERDRSNELYFLSFQLFFFFHNSVFVPIGS